MQGNIYSSAFLFQDTYQPNNSSCDMRAVLDVFLDHKMEKFREFHFIFKWVPNIFVHQRISQLKQKTELLVDFLYLSFIFDLPCQLSTNNENMQEHLILLPKLPKKTNQGISFAVSSFVDKNPIFCEIFLSLLNKYINHELSLEDTFIVENFISSASTIQTLKYKDSSDLIDFFLQVNSIAIKSFEKYPKSEYSFVELNKTLKKLTLTQINSQNEFICFKFQKLKALKTHLLSSNEVTEALTEKLKSENLILQNAVCFSNIDRIWNELPIKIENHLISETNEEVPENLRFKIVKCTKTNYLRLPKTLKDKVKNNRRFKPEYTLENTNWDYLKKLIGKTHWKVQNGIFAWFSIFVESFPYKLKVLRLLEKLQLEKSTRVQLGLSFLEK